jgi:hypothetical protein
MDFGILKASSLWQWPTWLETDYRVATFLSIEAQNYLKNTRRPKLKSTHPLPLS